MPRAGKGLRVRGLSPFGRAVAAALPALLCLQAATPPDYRGTPFVPAAYRAGQAAAAVRPKLPYHAFETALTVWDSKSPKGSGWVGPEQAGATIRLDEPDAEGKRVIHYHVAMENYQYAVFGWRWAAADDPPVDVRRYDAVSFSIRITGPRPPQELFFGVDELEPAPVSLREYDPEFRDGAWHRITIPATAMKWSAVRASAAASVRGFAFKTFVWEKAEYDIQLDRLCFERAVNPAVLAAARTTEPGSAPARPQVIPGRLECAFFDVGGEGVAYHDTTPVNILSAVLNQQSLHQRPHATAYEWNFRREEGVDLSFTKDFADLNHPNLFDIGPNQFYVGGAEDGEWLAYTVEVRKAGAYKIVAAYANDQNGRGFRLSLNNRPAADCATPVVTGGMHRWNKAEVGVITFPEAGRQLLTLHYGRGFNLAYFEFVPVR